MAAPVPPPTEPDASARICPGDQIGPCAACHRPTHKLAALVRPAEGAQLEVDLTPAHY
jgi:hypothetical protein